MPFDPLALLIALAVALVFGLFGWHVISQVRATSAALLRYADRRAEAQRNAIESESHDGESNVRRAAQGLSLFALIAILFYAALRKFGLL